MTRSKHEAATVAATNGVAMPRIEIVGERRRAYSAAFRAMVLAESGEPGARVREVGERHGISPSLIYRWRRLIGDCADGSAGGLVPVKIAAAPDDALSRPFASPREAMAARQAAVIEIELSSGVRVRVDEGVSVAALRRVMSVLRG